MRFYIVNNDQGETLHAAMSLHEAKAVEGASSITVMDVPITAETVRRLLAEWGGYATNIRHIDL